MAKYTYKVKMLVGVLRYDSMGALYDVLEGYKDSVQLGVNMLSKELTWLSCGSNFESIGLAVAAGSKILSMAGKLESLCARAYIVKHFASLNTVDAYGVFDDEFDAMCCAFGLLGMELTREEQISTEIMLSEKDLERIKELSEFEGKTRYEVISSAIELYYDRTM